MRSSLRLALLGSVAFAAALSSAAAWAADASSAAAAPAASTPAASAPAPAADPVVATVDGSPIRLSDLQAVREELAQQYPQLATVDIKTLQSGLIDRAVTEVALTNAARKSGLADDPEVKSAVVKAEAQILQNAYLKKTVEGQITDAKLQDRYQQYLKENPPEEEVHARHILVDSEDKAKAIIAKITKGAKFEDVASSDSTDPGSAKKGGDLGFFKKKDMVPEFAEAAFAMKPGEVSKVPVKSQFGWHIIKVEERHPGKQPDFAEVKDEVRGLLIQDLIRGTVDSLRKTVVVVKLDDQGKPIPDAPAAPAATSSAATPAK